MDSRRLILSSIALAALLWSTGEVQAQCTGQPGANQVCAGPASGGPGLPNFRAAVTADLPSTVGTVKSVAATVPASFLTLTGSPITASGTLAFGLVTTLADSYLGTKLAGTPGNLVFPQCNGTSQALQYTPGSGFVCATVGGAGGGNPGGTNGQIQYNNAGVFGGVTFTGDGSLNTATGAMAVTATGGNPFAASATTNALNANNINAGTLSSARGGAGTISGALKGDGAGVVTQAACGDLTNAAASCSTDATNAGNIGTGTLSNNRLNMAVTADFRAGTAGKILDAAVPFTTEVAIVQSGATLTLDFNQFINAQVVLSANVTTVTFVNVKAGQAGLIRLIQPNTGGPFTIPVAFSPTLKCGNGCNFVLSTSANAVDIVSYQCVTQTFCVGGSLLRNVQ